jgi:hypothetical protein
LLYNSGGLAEVNAQIQTLEKLLVDRVPGEQSAPSLGMMMQGKWRPFPNFDLFRRSEGVEQFAGWKRAGEPNNLIDLLSIPLRHQITDFKAANEYVASFPWTLYLIRMNDPTSVCNRCLKLVGQLCKKLTETHTSGSYYFRTSLIQAVFCEVLPLPLPPLIKSKLASSLSQTKKEFLVVNTCTYFLFVGKTRCVWATAVFDYATQVGTLRLLLELAQQYIASAKSLAPNRSFVVCFPFSPLPTFLSLAI